MRIEVRSKGQIIPLLAVLLIVVVSFTALAVDGSLIYKDRRTSQTVADSAALAGGAAATDVVNGNYPYTFYCVSTVANQAAIAAIHAAMNIANAKNVTLVNSEGQPNHINITCDEVTNTPFLDIHVQITTYTQTLFARIFRSQPITNRVEAVARVYPQKKYADGNAIVSLAHDCSEGGIYLEGTSSINIYDGGVFSNSCLSGKGHINLLVSGAKIQYMNTFTQTGQAYFDPAPNLASGYLAGEAIDPPDCSGLTTYGKVTHGGNLVPGIYTGISANSGETVHFAKGLYCIDGDFTANGNATVTGQYVTIYMRSGELKLDGTATVNLAAPNCNSSLCGVPPAIRGILFFIDSTNGETVQFSGTPTSSFVGTVYAPSSLVHISGTADYSTLQTQVIAKKVDIVGNVDFQIDLNGAYIYQSPSTVELLK